MKRGREIFGPAAVPLLLAGGLVTLTGVGTLAYRRKVPGGEKGYPHASWCSDPRGHWSTKFLRSFLRNLAVNLIHPPSYVQA